MARTYRLSPGTRAVNWVFAAITRAGVGASCRYILTVRGRMTGSPHSTPVDVTEATGHRWLVAGYGPANWARNARAAGEVTLRRAATPGGTRSPSPSRLRRSRYCASTWRRSGSPGLTSTPPRTPPTTRSRPNCPGTRSSGSHRQVGHEAALPVPPMLGRPQARKWNG